MQSSQPADLISVSDARRLIGVSRIKMAELIKKEVIRYYPYPVDRRVKLVSKAEVLALKNTRLNSTSDDSNLSAREKVA